MVRNVTIGSLILLFILFSGNVFCGVDKKISVGSPVGDILFQTNVDNTRMSIGSGGQIYFSLIPTDRLLYTGASGELLSTANGTYDGTTLTLAGELKADNLSLNGNTLSSTDTNGNIVLNPNGSGDVQLPDLVASRPCKLDASNYVVCELIDLADSTNEVTGILAIVSGGTNSNTALNNDRVMISSGGAIVESATVSTTELGLLDGRTYIPNAVGSSGQVGFYDATNSLVGSGNFTFIGGVLSFPLTDTNIMIGSGGASYERAMSGDGSLSNGGVFGISSGAIVNDDVNSGAAIARSKLANGTADYVMINSGAGVVSEEQYLAKVRGGAGADQTSVTYPSAGVIATAAGSGFQVAYYNGTASLIGSGNFTFDNENLQLDNEGDLRFSGSGAGYTALQAPSSTPSNVTLTLPDNDGDASQVLSTDGSGILSWEDQSGGGAGGGGINALINDDPSFETDVSNVTSNVGTITSESTEIYYLPDGKSLKIALSAQSADVEQCVTFTEWENVNVQVSCYIKSSLTSVQLCSSNDVTDPLCIDYDGSDVWKKVISSMTVDATGKMCWRVKSTSETGNIFVDECEIKELQPSVEPAISDATSFTPTFSDETNMTGKVGSYTQQGDRMLIEAYVLWDGNGAGSTMALTIPDGKTIDTSKIISTTYDRGIEGSGTWLNAGTYKPIQAGYLSTTTVLFKEMGTGNVLDGSQSVSGNSFSIVFSVPILNQASSTQFLAQNYDWYVDANIGGANPDLGTSSLSTYVGITNGSLDLVNNTDPPLNNIAIACSTTEEADIGDLTCSADESVGITFNGWVGRVKACASFNHRANINAAGTLYSTFQIVKTGNANQTIDVEGKERIESVIDASTVAVINAGRGLKICGVFSVNGKSTVRLFREQLVAATVSSHLIFADRSGTYGQRDIHWSVIPISGKMYASLADVVKTPGSGAYTPVIVSADISDAEAITEDESTFVSSCTNADPSVCTFAASFFNGDPKCWANPTVAGEIAIVTTDIEASATIDRTDDGTPFKLFCHGKQ